MTSLFSRLLRPETPPQPVPVVPTSSRIEALKTAVAGNNNTSKFIPFVPRQPVKSPNIKGLVGNISLPEIEITAPVNDNNINREVVNGVPEKLVTSSLQEIVNPAQILEAPVPAIEMSTKEPKINVPTFTPPQKGENIEIKEFASEHQEDSSRIFVNSFLGEINSLLVAGKNLEEMLKDKAEADKIFSHSTVSFEQMRSKRMAVASSIAQLFGDGEVSVSQESLKKVSEAYDTYLKSYNEEIENLTSSQRQEINKLSLKINAEKGKIKKMFEGAGGPANIDKIKNVIRLCESLAAKARGMVELPKEFKQEISKKVSNFVAGDLEGAKMLLGNPTDIVGLLVRIYTETGNTKN